MKNDLTPFEKNLLRAINFKRGKRYNHTHLMEWDTRKEKVEQGLQQGEVIYEVLGCYVAIKGE